MLRPVKFDTTRNPRTSQPHECRLDYLIIIYEMTLFNFIVRHLNPTTKLGKNHYFQIFVFQKNSTISFLLLFITYFFHYRIGIYHSRTALINSLFYKNRIFLLFTDLISRQHNGFFPSLYFAFLYSTFDKIFCDIFHDINIFF